MAKGVKKVKVTKGIYYPKMSVPGQRVTVKPDQWVTFEVAEWLPGTTGEEKKKPVIWMRQSNDRKVIISQLPSATGYKFKITKALCGNYHYYIEASLSGKRDTVNNAGIYVKGWCEPRIVASRWTTQRGSRNSIKNNKKTNYISYGNVVYLNLATEGLNGSLVSIEIWNQQYARKDKPIHTYNNVLVIDGEVNLKIENTYAWMAYVSNIQNVEEFYIKVKDASGNYLKDQLGDDLHAVYLNVKNKVATTHTGVSQNQTPTKVYRPDVNAARYEPCKFEVIKFTETEIKDGTPNNTTITVFDNGKGLRKLSGTPLQEKIVRTIFYKFDSTVIDKDGEAILNNVLKFLLEHKDSTMNLSGYACVIGKENYNKGLSQKRADIVKKFFADGGLDPGRIISTGKGEIDPTDDKMGRDNIRFRNEKDYENNRRVDISFVFNAHDAHTIQYEVVAPSVTMKKNLTVDIQGFDTKACFKGREKHKKEITVIDVGQALDKGDTKQSFTVPSFNYKVYSDLSKFNAFPIQYIWPSATQPNHFHLHVHSCRYFSREQRTTVLIKVYPDIKWELAFELLINVSNYKAANMPAGNIYAKHQEKAREAGYKRWRMNETGKVPISIGVNLSAEWDAGKQKRSLSNEFSDKIRPVARMLASAVNILQNAVNYAQSAAKETAVPAAFNIRYPKFTVVGKWYLERVGENKTLSTIGEVGFGLKPLIGAEVVIDIIGAAISAASYGTTGNPAAARIINKFRGSLEKLGASVVFTATFYGELEMAADALKIDSINGIQMQGKTTIGGKMGATIEMSVSVEVGTVKGTKAKPILTFKAAAKADSYFGGDFIIDSDEKGLFVQPVLKFSGAVLSVEIEGEVGWWKSNFKIEEKVLQEETYYMEKKYIT